MEKKIKRNLWISVSLFVVFVLYTVLVKFVDVQAIGPNDSKVGFASFNQVVHQWFLGNLRLYNMTDWGSVLPFAIAFIFAILGVVEWIQRKKLKKVDANILALGVCYICTFIVYVFFEFVVINRRPLLINGSLEASYPSSTTMLSCIILITCVDQIRIYIKDEKTKYLCIGLSIAYALFLIIGRIISGVHWASDIIGALLISAALIFGYLTLKDLFKEKLLEE